MKTRSYNIETRRKQQAVLKESIVAATAELHAAKGVIATSYPDIAKRAGVTLPTVHSHFPTQHELLEGCTSHIIAKAPVLPVEKIMASSDLPAAAKLLVAAMEQQHLHFEPWLVWREDRLIPFLAELAVAVRKSHASLVAKLLAQHLGPGERREMVAGWETILSFDFWHRLVRGHKLSRHAARRVLIQYLLAAVGPTLASPPIQVPRRKP